MKVITYVLLFNVIASIFPVKELLKIPFMIEHYKVHKKAEASMSVWKFIEIHYAGCKNIYGDESDDEKLPFKANDGKIDFINLSYVIISSPRNLPFFNNDVILEKRLFRFQDAFFMQPHIKLLQPPKIF